MQHKDIVVIAVYLIRVAVEQSGLHAWVGVQMDRYVNQGHQSHASAERQKPAVMLLPSRAILR